MSVIIIKALLLFLSYTLTEGCHCPIHCRLFQGFRINLKSAPKTCYRITLRGVGNGGYPTSGAVKSDIDLVKS